MLNSIEYYGVYRDTDISVNLMLENPLEYGVDVGLLVFSVTIRPRNGEVGVLRLDDFAFYVMDKDNHVCNACPNFLETCVPRVGRDGYIHG